MPAEWEPHKATWIAWPHNKKDWPEKFGPIPWVFAEIAYHISRFEQVNIICNTPADMKTAREACKAYGANLKNCRFLVKETDRVWLRDSGPTAIIENGKVIWVCWDFNAWAKYKNFQRDRQIGRFIAEKSGLSFEVARRPDNQKPLVLEGGSIESNGAGTILVTKQCFSSLGDQVRNPLFKSYDYANAFRNYLGAEDIIWLEALSGDETSHVDNVARFVAKDRIALAYKFDPIGDHDRSCHNRQDLTDKGFDVLFLPCPQERKFWNTPVPASYANFYIGNGFVLVPTFNDPADGVAIQILKTAFPDREVIGIHCLDLVWGFGTIHCATQQEPQSHQVDC